MSLGGPVISNCGYFTENISAFLDYHLQPLAQKVKSYIKDTNDFLKKLRELPNLPKDFLLCTVDVVGLYPNIPHDDGLAVLRNVLEKREEKTHLYEIHWLNWWNVYLKIIFLSIMKVTLNKYVEINHQHAHFLMPAWTAYMSLCWHEISYLSFIPVGNLCCHEFRAATAM